MTTTQKLGMAVLVGMLASMWAAHAGEVSLPVTEGRNNDGWDLRGAQPSDAFKVGDIVSRERGTGRFTMIPVGGLIPALQQKKALFIVTESRTDEFAAVGLEYDAQAEAVRQRGASLWRGKKAEGPGLNCQDNWAAFVGCLLSARGELLVSQNAHGLCLGDVVCLNERSGYLVRVPIGQLRAEEAMRTPLFLVTETRDSSAEFTISRIHSETVTPAAEVGGDDVLPATAVGGAEYARASLGKGRE